MVGPNRKCHGIMDPHRRLAVRCEIGESRPHGETELRTHRWLGECVKRSWRDSGWKDSDYYSRTTRDPVQLGHRSCVQGRRCELQVLMSGWVRLLGGHALLVAMRDKYLGMDVAIVSLGRSGSQVPIHYVHFILGQAGKWG